MEYPSFKVNRINSHILVYISSSESSIGMQWILRGCHHLFGACAREMRSGCAKLRAGCRNVVTAEIKDWLILRP